MNLRRPRGSPRAWLTSVGVTLALLILVIVLRSSGEGAGPGSQAVATGGTPSHTSGGSSSPPHSHAATSAASPASATTSSAPAVRLYAAHGEASLIPALEGKRPLFILSLGSDARPGQTIQGQRSDSIHVIGVNLQTNRATILGFPRDSYVPIPGHGTSKINSAMVYGGPDLTVRTIEQLTGIHVDFWMLTSFPGLVNMVNGIGGLTVDVPQPMHDSYSHANFQPGPTRMNGKQALAFARDRHDVPGGDLGRSRDQGILLISALSKLRDSFEANPATAFTWLRAGWNEMRTDLSVSTMLQLALTATRIPATNVNNLVVPAVGGSVGGKSVVFLLPSAHAIYADMRTDGVATAD
jgi:polyisoprenyl-teichoic acid--peptidoglycan teichoic acid transferase